MNSKKINIKIDLLSIIIGIFVHNREFSTQKDWITC